MEGDKGLDGRGTGVDGVQKSAELYDVLGLDDSPERGLVLEDGESTGLEDGEYVGEEAVVFVCVGFQQCVVQSTGCIEGIPTVGVSELPEFIMFVDEWWEVVTARRAYPRDPVLDPSV